MGHKHGVREGGCSFDTRSGRAAIRWTAKGVSRLHLPEADRRRAGRRPGGDRPPSDVVRVIRQVQGYFAGGAITGRPRLDLSGATPFERAVYRAVRSIPPGKVRTYGEIARSIGRPRSARAVGGAMRRNPVPLFIPCHRVVSSAGLGGFSAAGGLPLKRMMLALEGLPSTGPRRGRPA